VPKKMHLAFALSWLHLDGRWRTPGSWVGRTYPDIRMFEEIAMAAERGCVDMLFFGDGTGIPNTWRGSPDVAVQWGIQWPRQDMSPYIASLARITKHIGFALTYASTFMHPFYVARLLNSLDHITGGRIALNVVTSTRRADAANYGFDELMEHAARYDRMEEFVDVCKALWSSVKPDAFVWDRESGIVADPAKVSPIDHDGKFFKVKGPLNTVPSPQHHPLLIQAGGSPRGIRACAHFADIAFGASKSIAAQARHRRDLDAALVAEGRDPAEVGILWETNLVVGRTAEAAKAHREQMLTMIPREAVGAFISHQAGYDFSKLPQRFSLLELNDEIARTQASPVGFVHLLAQRVGETAEITREEFFEHGIREATQYDHTIAGTAEHVADHLEEVFEATGGHGGFMVAFSQATPGDFLNIVDLLVPELQRRGRFRTEYEGKTLRESFGLVRGDG
jgi:FMN-dependent oxidoreductase (nitrilotriacetate monooxygenase family)